MKPQYDEVAKSLEEKCSCPEFEEKFFKAGLSYKKGLTPQDVDIKEFKKGLEVEQEHTTCEKIAMKITLDHLAEDPAYYSKLEKAGL